MLDALWWWQSRKHPCTTCIEPAIEMTQVLKHFVASKKKLFMTTITNTNLSKIFSVFMINLMINALTKSANSFEIEMIFYIYNLSFNLSTVWKTFKLKDFLQMAQIFFYMTYVFNINFTFSPIVRKNETLFNADVLNNLIFMLMICSSCFVFWISVKH